MRQLIKFCIVGASSTVIDMAILAFLLRFVPALPWWVSMSISFCFAVSNGFIWNQRWTFRTHNSGSTRTQYAKFFVTNVIGLGLNLLISKGFLILFTGQITHPTNPDEKSVLLAKLCAIPLVVIWNFGASRLWTFKPHEPKAQTWPEVKTSSPVSESESRI